MECVQRGKYFQCWYYFWSHFCNKLYFKFIFTRVINLLKGPTLGPKMGLKMKINVTSEFFKGNSEEFEKASKVMRTEWFILFLVWFAGREPQLPSSFLATAATRDFTLLYSSIGLRYVKTQLFMLVFCEFLEGKACLFWSVMHLLLL